MLVMLGLLSHPTRRLSAEQSASDQCRQRQRWGDEGWREVDEARRNGSSVIYSLPQRVEGGVPPWDAHNPTIPQRR
jgi:hypothetical protein